MNHLPLLAILVLCSQAAVESAPFNYDAQKCGRTAMNEYREDGSRINKMMGGLNALGGEVPWAVAILLDNAHLGAGTLVSTKHVITSAELFAKSKHTYACKGPSIAYSENEILKRFSVGYGSNCLWPFRKCAKVPLMMSVGIRRVSYLGYYNSQCNQSDIAFLELEEEVNKTLANYACLPHRIWPKTLAIQSKMIVSGWGADPIDRNRDKDRLQVMPVRNMISYELCEREFEVLPADAICSTDIYSRNLCMGDDGAGLMQQDEGGQWVLFGVVSFSTRCELMEENWPNFQVYTSVLHYAADIDEFIGEYDVCRAFVGWEVFKQC